MKKKLSFRPRTAAVFMLMIIAAAVLSLFALQDLNVNVVNSELYDYGLVFDTLWFNEYWKYLQFLFLSVTATIILASFSIALIGLYAKTGFDPMRIFGSFLIACNIFASVFSVSAFAFIDWTVNNSLYNFGLQFSISWYDPYSWFSGLFLAAQTIIVILSIASFGLTFFSSRMPLRTSYSRFVSFFLILFSVGLIGFSLLYDYLLSLLAGLGLLFWGTILSYVHTESYLKREVLEATSLSYLTSLGETLNKFEPLKRVVYLPSKYNKGEEPNKIYVVKNPSEKLNFEAMKKTDSEKQEDNILTAPGNELLRLFEEILGVSYSEADLAFFERTTPKLLVEDLELAQNVEIEVAENVTKVRMENLLDSSFLIKAKEHARTVNLVGIPLSSAIACALANSSGKPVVINSHEISEDGKVLDLEYAIVDDEVES